MKTLVVVLAIAAVALGASVPHFGLKQEFYDIQALIPADELSSLVHYYAENDEEFRNIINYYVSDGWSKLYSVVLKQQEVLEFIRWVAEHYDINSIILNKQALHLFPSGVSVDRHPGWKGFMEAFLEIMPMEEISGLIKDKVSEDELFAEFWRRVQELRVVYERLLTDPDFIEVIHHLESLGFDGQQYDQYIRKSFGWY